MIEPIVIGKATLYNMDCMKLLTDTPDNYYDLAIVDPPYGIGVSKNGFSTIEDGGKSLAKRKNYGIKNWDNSIPENLYFLELIRCSKNQIIWGGNYFLDNLGKTSCFLIWDKDNGSFSMADCEIAWTSFKTAIRLFKYTWSGMLQGDMKNKEIRIHPTQKPVKLYEWILTNYAKQGDKILDTHLGSGSHVIACNNLGFELTACELDKDYYDASVKRITLANQQVRMFA